MGFLKAPSSGQFYIMSVLSLVQIMEHYNISYQSYAEDTQLCVSVSVNDHSPLYVVSKCKNLINGSELLTTLTKKEIIVFSRKEETLKIRTCLLKGNHKYDHIQMN